MPDGVSRQTAPDRRSSNFALGAERCSSVAALEVLLDADPVAALVAGLRSELTQRGSLEISAFCGELMNSKRTGNEALMTLRGFVLSAQKACVPGCGKTGTIKKDFFMAYPDVFECSIASGKTHVTLRTASDTVSPWEYPGIEEAAFERGAFAAPESGIAPPQSASISLRR